MVRSSHTGFYPVFPQATVIAAGNQPAGEPGDGGGGTVRGGSLRQLLQPDGQRRRPRGGQIQEAEHFTCLPSQCADLFTEFGTVEEIQCARQQ